MVVTQTDLPGLRLAGRGKVRDIYEVGEQLLIVSTDRLSAYDVVLPDGIPDKGRVLTQLSRFWFGRVERIVPNHLMSVEPTEFPRSLLAFRDLLDGRTMLVRRARPLPVECVVRGYLAGSGWQEYRATGRVCGIELAPGLSQADRLPEPIFTPATKAKTGHDQNISFEDMAMMVGRGTAERARQKSLQVYQLAAEHARERGIIIADTKFEFGTVSGELILIDEVLTPDSSRLWALKDYRVGCSPPSFDKQFVRDWLDAQGWNRLPPAPRLPAEVVAGTAARYREAYRRLTGNELA
jgi:phosphoribosylaminoimidazole-succinocarboxamide synthase